jgi:type IV pilus assembly protein PilV
MRVNWQDSETGFKTTSWIFFHVWHVICSISSKQFWTVPMKRTMNEKGFTLLELLVALTIFAIGMLSVASMQVTALRENANSHSRTAAVTLASGILEEIQRWSPDDPRFSADVTAQDWNSGNAIAIDGAGAFRATYDLDRNFNGVQNVIRIQVNVTGGGTRPVSLVSFKRAV